MKKLFLLIWLVPFSLCAHARSAGGVGHGDYHFGYISLSGGYTSISQNIPQAHTKGNWGGLLGIGYEFRMNNGWVSAGVQYMQHRSATSFDEYNFQTPFGGFDDQQPPQKVTYYRYTVRQTDKQDWHSIDIPLLAGFYKNGFYMGAGFKVGFFVRPSISTEGELDLAAQYDRYIGEIHDWNYYGTYPCPSLKTNCELQTQVSLLGEIGYDLLSSMDTRSTVCHMLKIGIYAEYGLHSVLPAKVQDPVLIEGKSMIEAAEQQLDVCHAHMTPYYLSSMSSDKRVVPFYVGIKLTYLIGGSWSSTATWHKGCQCYGN